ncbi:MAG: hypothetical protein AAFR26_24100 [Cyanobacteria bacterium J06626_4]
MRFSPARTTPAFNLDVVYAVEAQSNRPSNLTTPTRRVSTDRIPTESDVFEEVNP